MRWVQRPACLAHLTEIQMTTDIKLFTIDKQPAREVPGRAAAVEKSLQRLVERNLEVMLGIRLLASEHSTGKKHRGRIDTLGIDENSCPVIIEYKRSTNENVINQGLFYLDWLLDHRSEFKLLVLGRLGEQEAEKIDWSAPRLLCIAGGFNRYDEYAVEQINRNIELIRYRRFGESFLMLEMVNATSATPEPAVDPPAGGGKTIAEVLSTLDGPIQELYEALRESLLALGDDVHEKTLKYYVAFKRLRNFACVNVLSSKEKIVLYLKVDPETITLEPGFTRNVRGKGTWGTGDLELSLRSLEDLERAKPLLQQSYEVS